jgi:fibrillarin-like rRNA methylase
MKGWELVYVAKLEKNIFVYVIDADFAHPFRHIREALDKIIHDVHPCLPQNCLDAAPVNKTRIDCRLK